MSDLVCHGTTRAGERCARLGHRIADGKRYCSLHSGDEYEKQAIMCAGLDGSGLPCRTAANSLADGQPVCNYHSQIHAESGVLQAPAKKKSAKQPEEVSVNGDGDTGFDLIPGGLDQAMLTLRQRLQGVGQASFTEIEGVIRDGLRSKRSTQTTCPSCKHRFRVYTSDMGTRLMTVKLVLERLVSPDRSGGAGGGTVEETYVPSLPLDELTTAELRRLAFPNETGPN